MVKDMPLNSKGNDGQDTDTRAYMCIQVGMCTCMLACACVFVPMPRCMAMHVPERQKKR